MTFREIIEAALEECGAMSPRDNWRWKWDDTELDVYFYGSTRSERPERCLLYWHHAGACLAHISPPDLLDPNWSPITLAKRINDRIARLKK